jgi:hypothetical protein
MPNHCNNKLGILGLKEDVEQFIELVTNHGSNKENDKYELFANLLPMPKELVGTSAPSKEKNEQLIEKYGSDNWYDWCNENWGTKWGDYSLTSSEITYEVINEYSTLENGEKDYDTSIPKITGRASIHFDYDTAWAPGCEELANGIVNRFPKLSGFISYEEPGMGFAGQLIFTNGSIVRHDQWEFNQKFDDVNDIDFDYLGGRSV